jgi:hypothetical protein
MKADKPAKAHNSSLFDEFVCKLSFLKLQCRRGFARHLCDTKDKKINKSVIKMLLLRYGYYLWSLRFLCNVFVYFICNKLIYSYKIILLFIDFYGITL